MTRQKSDALDHCITQNYFLMAKKLSNVALMPAVEGISRKLALRREKCYNKTLHYTNQAGTAVGKEVFLPGSTYMGVISTDYGIIGHGVVKRNVLFMRKPMNAPVTTTNQARVRAIFANGVAWANDAAADLSAITQNQITFLNCVNNGSGISGVSPKGYHTMLGWMKAVAIRALSLGKELPASNLLDDIH